MSNEDTPKIKHYYWDRILKEVTQAESDQTPYYHTPNKTKPHNSLKAKTNSHITLNSKNTAHTTTLHYSHSSKPIKRYQLCEPFTQTYFTQREADALIAIIQEKTIIAAAKRLQLSPRTIEFYFGNIKKKLNCNKKREVIELANHLKLIEILEKQT